MGEKVHWRNLVARRPGPRGNEGQICGEKEGYEHDRRDKKGRTPGGGPVAPNPDPIGGGKAGHRGEGGEKKTNFTKPEVEPGRNKSQESSPAKKSQRV